MPFNANFTGVTLTDGTLEVQGTSLPGSGATAIVVTLVHGSAVRTATADQAGRVAWTARFPPGPTAFQLDDEVFLVGVATREGHDPFVWQGGFAVTDERDPGRL
jgi:hypothetical protein